MSKEHPSMRVLDTLDKAFKDDKARVPENLFKKYLLPSLVNVSDERADLSMWLQLAGNYTRDIIVVDEKDPSLELFELPALIARSELPKGADSTNIDGIVGDVHKRAEVSERAAGQYLNAKLSNLIQVSGNRDANIQKWNTMFERYGYTDLLIKTDTADVQPTKSTDDLKEVGSEDF